ncbi:MAG: hypothetical protein K0S73_7 [Stenotrophomonas rhizophila]|jgi:hypothetical protein|nr:hypothetical protein [Stenotrophomonas rhizophila]
MHNNQGPARTNSCRRHLLAAVLGSTSARSLEFGPH